MPGCSVAYLFYICWFLGPCSIAFKPSGLFWLPEGGFRVSSGTVRWCTSSFGADFENYEMASPVLLVLCSFGGLCAGFGRLARLGRRGATSIIV